MNSQTIKMIVGMALCSTGVMAGNWSDAENRDTGWPNNGNVSGNIYTIHTAKQLAQFAYTVEQNTREGSYRDKTVQLMANIDLSGRDWIPIGAKRPEWSFCGTFDGNGKTISGLTINQKSSSGIFAGLFAYMENGVGNYKATVKNIRFTDVDIYAEGTGSAAVEAGTVVGVMGDGLIENCFVVNGTIRVQDASGSFVYAGGIAGAHEKKGTIRNCVNAATIEALGGDSAYVGGIAGRVRGAWVQNCQNIGTLKLEKGKASGIYIGGIAGGVGTFPGITEGNFIENCLNTGDIICSHKPGYDVLIGAIVGGVETGLLNGKMAVVNAYYIPVPGLAPQGENAVATSILPVGEAPGSVTGHPDYGNLDLETALNNWAIAGGPAYLHWSVIPGMNDGYPVLTDILTMQKYKVYLDPAGGYGGVQEIWATFGEAMPGDAVAPTRPGYAFLGFFDGSGAQYYGDAMTSEQNWDKEHGDTLTAYWKALHDGIIVPDVSTDDPDDYFVITQGGGDISPSEPSDHGEGNVDVHPGNEIGHEPDGDGYPFIVPEVPGYPDGEYDYVFDPDIPAVLVIDPGTGETNAVIRVPSGEIEGLPEPAVVGEFLNIGAIEVDTKADTVTLRWDPKQVDGTIIYYEIHATDTLSGEGQRGNWDIYTHDGVAVIIIHSRAGEDSAVIKPSLLEHPFGDKEFFKVKAFRREHI